MRLLPRTLSTASALDAPLKTVSLSPQHQQQPPRSQSATRPPRRNGNRNSFQGKKHDGAFFPDFTALFPDLAARSAHLEDVALGKVADNTVGMDDYVAALEGWMELARERTGPGEERGEVSSSWGGIAAARRSRSLLLALERYLDPETSTPTGWRPTSYFYEVVLQVYAVCGRGVVAAREAEAFAGQHAGKRTDRPVSTAQSIESKLPRTQHQMLQHCANLLGSGQVRRLGHSSGGGVFSDGRVAERLSRGAPARSVLSVSRVLPG